MSHHTEVAEDSLSYRVIGVAIDVHKVLGPGHGEMVYHQALCVALEREGLSVQSEVEIEIEYGGSKIGKRFADLLVEEELILELKAVKEIDEKHVRQLGVNVRMAKKRRGLVLNFGEPTLGIRRFVNSRNTQEHNTKP